MRKVIFVGDWGESSQDILNRYSRQTPSNSGIWEDVQGVSNIEEADYCILMNGTTSDTSELDWSRVIYFQREPHFIKPLFMNHNFPSDILYDGTYEKCHNVPTWWINLSFDELNNLRYPTKTKKISTVTSGKSGIETYNNRLNFLRNFCQEYKNTDVYGRGTQQFVGECWKGELNYDKNCKFKGHEDYEYSLVLENVLEPNTWTEKPSDSFLAWSLPIYSGASNFIDYFPEESFYQIDTTNYDINKIIDFISEPPSRIQIEALKEARQLLLHKWNIWPTIKRILDERT
jgi:hypothetical protein